MAQSWRAHLKGAVTADCLKSSSETAHIPLPPTTAWHSSDVFLSIHYHAHVGVSDVTSYEDYRPLLACYMRKKAPIVFL